LFGNLLMLFGDSKMATLFDTLFQTPAKGPTMMSDAELDKALARTIHQ
jgi:hypothetical protein